VGNQSPILRMQIVVTPVIPWDGSRTTTDTLYLGWRDFFQKAGANAGAIYHVRCWPDNDTNPSHAIEHTGVGTIDYAGPYTFSSGQTYDWYVEWSFDGGATYLPENRSPPYDPKLTPTAPYHQFTAF
jgi:hypothetical protein